MRTTASRIARGLALAAVPVLVAGCSGSSDSEASGDSGPAAAASAKPKKSATPSLAPARFTGLPQPCKVLEKGTVKKLVPKAKDPSGKPAKSTDLDARASCSWNGLNGFQYRWLEISFQRADSVQGIGSAETQAKSAYTQLKAAAAVPEGLKKGKRAAIRVVPGLGDEAQLVSAEVKKDGEAYRDVSVIARADNVVVSISYDAAGFETAKLPKAKVIEEGAATAAKKAMSQLK